MTLIDLIAEIWAITPKDCKEIDLPNDTDGDIAGLVSNFHTKQLACFYLRKVKEIQLLYQRMEPYTRKNEYLPSSLEAEFNSINSQVELLWKMLAYDLETQFGHLLTLQERSEDFCWVIRTGWILWKTRNEDGSKRVRKIETLKRRSMMI